MRALNFGSMNLDTFYHVDHFVRPGETLDVADQHIAPGGKGLNQSLALSRAGIEVWHAGCVGAGGKMLVELLEENGVHTEWIQETSVLQGQALIQVNPQGENAILLFAGSNHAVTSEQVEAVLDTFDAGDYLILQNEISCLGEILNKAAEKGLNVVFNPSPFDESLRKLNYHAVRWILVNEGEALSLSGETDPKKAWKSIHQLYPSSNLVITLGGDGAWCFTEKESIYQPAIPVHAVDTTGAGDTFTGYFIAGIMGSRPLAECMYRAAKAASITVSRKGAAPAIPRVNEIE